MEASGSPSLVLVEQHEALREGLAVLLERRGFEVRGCATTAVKGEKVIAQRHPDIAVVGVDLPDERGTELVKWLNERPPCGDRTYPRPQRDGKAGCPDPGRGRG